MKKLTITVLVAGLFACCGILNLFNYDYKFTELDLCIDMNTDIKNIFMTTMIFFTTNYLKTIIIVMVLWQ